MARVRTEISAVMRSWRDDPETGDYVCEETPVRVVVEGPVAVRTKGAALKVLDALYPSGEGLRCFPNLKRRTKKLE